MSFFHPSTHSITETQPQNNTLSGHASSPVRAAKRYNRRRNQTPRKILYTAIQRSAIVRFVAVHSVYFTRSASAAITCLIDQIEGPDNTGLITRAPLNVELPGGPEEPTTNPYVAFVCTPDAGIGAVVQDALTELYILTVGGDMDKETDFRRVVGAVSDALCLYGTDPNEGKVSLRWDAIHTLGFAIEAIPETSPLYTARQKLGDFLSFLSPAPAELAQSE